MRSQQHDVSCMCGCEDNNKGKQALWILCGWVGVVVEKKKERFSSSVVKPLTIVTSEISISSLLGRVRVPSPSQSREQLHVQWFLLVHLYLCATCLALQPPLVRYDTYEYVCIRGVGTYDDTRSRFEAQFASCWDSEHTLTPFVCLSSNTLRKVTYERTYR